MSETMLVTCRRNGNQLLLTWNAPATWALLAQTLMRTNSEVLTLPARSDQVDPLDAWQEEQAAQQVHDLAEQYAARQEQQAANVMQKLALSGAASIDDGTAWSLACVANATYVRMRSADMQQTGRSAEPGEPSQADVDSALAQILGHETPASHLEEQNDQDNYWEPDTWLMAVLAHELTQAFTGEQ